MKATGVVRRIDDLGRVVIPKEIRKTLRIKEGEPLEIFTDREGQVILKKYSPIGELSEFASGYAETLSKTTGHIACITDKDTVIAISGGPKKEFLEQNVSEELEQLMEDKEVYTSKENSDVSVPITKNDRYSKAKTCSSECRKILLSNNSKKSIKQRKENGTFTGWKVRNIESYAETFWRNVLDNNNIQYKREYQW